MLVRITTADGERVVGPLAEVRGDTIHLSTTTATPARSMALTGVRAIAYQDGKEFHGRKGALIGAGIGVLIGLLGGGCGDRECVPSPRQMLTICGVLGAGIGGLVGLANGTPHWRETDASAMRH